MKQFLLLTTIFVLCLPFAWAQETISHKGFELQFSTNMYWGSVDNANFYSGILKGEDNAAPDITRITTNSLFRDKIENLLDDNYTGITTETLFTANNDYNSGTEGISNMRYGISFNFAIEIRYHVNSSFSFGLYFSQSILTAKGTKSFAVNSSNYNTGGLQYIEEQLLGKETRNFFGINFTYMYRNNSRFYPLVEFGTHLNSVKVKSSELIVEGVAFDLIDHYGGVVYTGDDRTEIDPHLGGVGYGFIASAGVRISFTEYLAVEPLFSVSIEKLKLDGYDKIRPNYSLGIRFVLGDKVFAK